MSITLLIVLLGLYVRSFRQFRSGASPVIPCAIQPMSDVKIAGFDENGESMFIRAIVLAGCLTIASTSDTHAQPSNEHLLHVEIEGLRNNNGQMLGELHTSATWLSKENAKAVVLAKSIIAHNHATCEFSGIAAGEYAVSVIHNENSNGKLDKNFLGMPREGFGMSNDVIPRFGPPKFEAVAFSFDGGTSDIKIVMRYL